MLQKEKQLSKLAEVRDTVDKMLDKLKKDIVIAQKSKDKDKLAVLRYVKSALKNVEIDLKHPLNNDEIIKVMQQQVKQRKQASELYIRGGRNDLAQHEQKEIEIISSYLPKPLTEEEMLNEVIKAIKELDAQSMKEMGKVIKHLKEKFGASVDGKIISSIVKEKLSK